MRQTLAGLIVLTTLLTAGGCSFDRKWRNLAHAEAAAVGSTTQPADALAGRWDGKWLSEATGHGGRLRAIITPVDATTYRAEYQATYLGLLRFGYGMNLTAAAQPDGAIAFEGQENLGSLAGGVYRYNGSADGKTFHSSYESSADHGRFEMKRSAD